MSELGLFLMDVGMITAIVTLIFGSIANDKTVADLTRRVEQLETYINPHADWFSPGE